jgi:4-hydroxy-tetrahydrodipicolinate synthase
MFIETNPAPIKYALWRKGLCLPDMRLPLTLPSAKARDAIDEAMRKYERGE